VAPKGLPRGAGKDYRPRMSGTQIGHMMKLSRMVGCCALTLVMWQIGCGAGGGGESATGGAGSDGGIMAAPPGCGTVDPCGGDLTGTWKVLGGCLTPLDFTGTACPQETAELLSLSYTGSLTFNSDMTYTTTEFIENSRDLETIPSSCLGKSCAQYDTEVKTLNMGTGVSGGCTGSTTCACSFTRSLNVFGNSSGTYSVLGNQLTVGTSQHYSWCVQGDTLHLITDEITVNDSTGMSTTLITSDIVAQRQ
jgi:hypothetical protein